MNMTLEVYCVWGERIRDIEPKDIGVRYGRVVQTRDGADEDEGCVGHCEFVQRSAIRRLNDTYVVEDFLHAHRKIWGQLP